MQWLASKGTGYQWMELVIKTVTKCVQLIVVNVCSQKKKGLIILVALIAHHTPTLTT